MTLAPKKGWTYLARIGKVSGQSDANGGGGGGGGGEGDFIPEYDPDLNFGP